MLFISEKVHREKIVRDGLLTLLQGSLTYIQLTCKLFLLILNKNILFTGKGDKG